MSARPRIGELLVNLGLLTREQLETALEQQRTQGATGRRLGQLLVDLGFIGEVQLTKMLSQHLSVPWVSLHHIDFSRQLLNLVPKDVAEEFCVIPIYVRHERKVGDTLYLAMEDPTHDEAVRQVTAACGMPVKAMIAAPSDIRGAIRAFYGGTPADSPAAPVSAAPPPRRSVAPAKPAAPPPPPTANKAPPTAAATTTATPIANAKPVADEPPSATVSDVTAPEIKAPPPSHDSIPPAQVAASEEFALPAVESPRAPAASLPAMPKPAPGASTPRREKPPVAAVKPGGPRMLALTLLDGTTISIPSQRKRDGGATPASEAAEASGHERKLTSRDLVAALRAVASGADVDEALGDARWETLFAALLSVLLRKQLISDWEFVEEWQAHIGSE